VPTNKEFYCSVCNQSFDSAFAFQTHNSSSKHRVNLLAQQLESSGSFHANLQGLQVSEFAEATNLEVGRAVSVSASKSQPQHSSAQLSGNVSR
jgi:hypothetical protein